MAGMRLAFTQSSMVLVVTLRRLASWRFVMSSVVSEGGVAGVMAIGWLQQGLIPLV